MNAEQLVLVNDFAARLRDDRADSSDAESSSARYLRENLHLKKEMKELEMKLHNVLLLDRPGSSTSRGDSTESADYQMLRNDLRLMMKENSELKHGMVTMQEEMILRLQKQLGEHFDGHTDGVSSAMAAHTQELLKELQELQKHQTFAAPISVRSLSEKSLQLENPAFLPPTAALGERVLGTPLRVNARDGDWRHLHQHSPGTCSVLTQY